MLPATPQPNSHTHHPFRIHLHQQDSTPDGHFRPEAILQVTPVLRTSGLLRSLPGEEMKTLLLLLTFLTPNGEIQPTLSQIAQALRLPVWMAARRIHRLQRFFWQGKTLAYPLYQNNSLHGVTPSLHLLEYVQQSHTPDPNQGEIVQGGSREAVIAHSRATYGRPREIVEREIAEANGWLPIAEAPATNQEAVMEDPEVKVLRERLLKIGIGYDQADLLLARFGKDLVAQQIVWLPYRNAKKPAAYLVAAIEGDYSEPSALLQLRSKIPEESEAAAQGTETQVTE